MRRSPLRALMRMRINFPDDQVRPSVFCLTANVIFLALFHPAQAQADDSQHALGAEEIRTRLAGRSFESQNVAGSPIFVEFRADGTVLAASNDGTATGRWHAEDGRFCRSIPQSVRQRDGWFSRSGSDRGQAALNSKSEHTADCSNIHCRRGLRPISLIDGQSALECVGLFERG